MSDKPLWKDFLKTLFLLVVMKVLAIVIQFDVKVFLEIVISFSAALFGGR